MPIDLTDQPIWLNLGLFLAGAGAVWYAGLRLAIHADAIAERKQLARAVVGAMILAGATSLPEIATTCTASAIGNAPMAVNNLLGGIAMQTAILAVVDLVVVRGAMTYFSPKPVLMLAGVLLVVQIAVCLMAIAAGEIASFAGTGVWPIVLAVAYYFMLRFVHGYEGRPGWKPVDIPDEVYEREQSRKADGTSPASRSDRALYLIFGAYSLVVLIGGTLVSTTADALSKQTHLSGGFVGATFVAIATSLPEVSATMGAARLGAYTLAISNIFGSNALMIALVLPADLIYRGGPIMDAVDDSAVFTGAIGILVTALYLWGLVERRDRTVLGMGIDSTLVLVAYFLGVVMLYQIS